MQIHGIQKLTLLDFPGHTACTVFTGACNFRCPFCHNASLVLNPSQQPLVPEKDVLAYLASRKGLLDGVCITGGEPTLQEDLLEFMGKVKALDLAVKLDTNGWDPETLAMIVENGFADYVAMDVKSSRERYAEACGLKQFDTAQVEESVKLLKKAIVPYEFRTTVVRELHDTAVMEAIGEWLGDVPRYFLQNFKDSGDLLTHSCTGCSPSEMQALLAAVRQYIPSAELRGVS